MNIKKNIAYGLCTGVVLFTGWGGVETVKSVALDRMLQSRKPVIEEIINTEYSHAVTQVQDFFGTTFTEVPRIRYTLTDTETIDMGWGMMPTARYTSDGANTIHISSAVFPHETDTVWQKLIGLVVYKNPKPMPIVQHELTHALADQISNEKCNREMGQNRNKADHILQEGIAQYAQIHLNPTEGKIDCKVRTTAGKTIDQLDNYKDGYCFVKPILHVDRKRGMEYLECHRPTAQDILEPKLYYEKVWRSLHNYSRPGE